MPTIRSDYVAPRWLPGAHLQTVVPARFFPRPHVSYRRELIDMPDGDFMTFDWVKPEPEALTAPVLVHFHGLEGDSHSHYAEALMHECVLKGWRGVVAHFRGCGGLQTACRARTSLATATTASGRSQRCTGAISMRRSTPSA